MGQSSISSDWSEQDRADSDRAVEPLESEQNGSSHHRNSFATSSRTISRLSRLSRLVTASAIEDELFDEKEIPNMGSGKGYPPFIEEDKYLVTFDGADDPLHPFNWPMSKKLNIGMIVSMYSLCNSLGSSIYSQSSPSLKEIFQVGDEVATVATSLYVLGFAFGPVIWAPLSELHGRKKVFLPSCLGFTLFSFAVATANDLQTIMICRFFSGFCGGSAMVLSSSTLGDMFPPRLRGRAMAPFGLTVCVGPLIGPIMGGFTAKNDGLGWRWNEYWCGILGAIILVFMALFLQETYHPVVLTQKAASIRYRTKNWAVHSAQETLHVTFSELCVKYLVRPVIMLCTEPILLSLALYGGFVYGLMFMLLEAVPMVFSGGYHFPQGVAELPYLSVAIGAIGASVILILFDMRYRRLSAQINNAPIPEERLLSMMIGGGCITTGLFWFFWTGNYPDTIPWIVPTIGISFVGIGLLTVIQPCINYVVDLYGGAFAASALAGLSFVRAFLGAVFPLFARPMFTNLNLNWSGTLLGCLSFLLIPMPFLFYFYGTQIRRYSKFLKSQT